MMLTTRPTVYFIEKSQSPLLEPDCRDHGTQNEKKIVATDAKKAFEIFKQQNKSLKFFAASVEDTGTSFAGYGRQFSICTILFRPYAKVSQTIVLPFVETEEVDGKVEVAFCGMRDLEGAKIHFLRSNTTASYVEGAGVVHQTHARKVIEVLSESGIERKSLETDEDLDKYELDSFNGNFELGALKLKVKIKKLIQMKLDQNAASGDEAVTYLAYMKTKKTKSEVSEYFSGKNFCLLDVTNDLKEGGFYSSTNQSAMKILTYLSDSFLSQRDTKATFFKGLEILRDDFQKKIKKRRMKIAVTAIAIVVCWVVKDCFIKRFARS